jgi:hypothetical protein
LLLIGWALFNMVEGIVDHHILTLHRVRDDVAERWPLAFPAVDSMVDTVSCRLGYRVQHRPQRMCSSRLACLRAGLRLRRHVRIAPSGRTLSLRFEAVGCTHSGAHQTRRQPFLRVDLFPGGCLFPADRGG